MPRIELFVGTVDEITLQLQQNYDGQKLRVSVEVLAEATDEAVLSTHASNYFMSTSNRTLAETAGSFKDSAFFDDVVENIRLRREEEIRQFIEEEEKENSSLS